MSAGRRSCPKCFTIYGSEAACPECGASATKAQEVAAPPERGRTRTASDPPRLLAAGLLIVVLCAAGLGFLLLDDAGDEQAAIAPTAPLDGSDEVPLPPEGSAEAVADAQASFARGASNYRMARYALAKRDFERVAVLDPSNAEALNNLAWILAAAPDPLLRDGERAVQIAKAALEVSSAGDRAKHLDTLAAAWAEMGDFAAAIAVQKTALRELGDGLERASYQGRLRRYRGGEAARLGGGG